MADAASPDNVVITKLNEPGLAPSTAPGFIPAEDPPDLDDGPERDYETAEMLRMLGINPGKTAPRKELRFPDDDGEPTLEEPKKDDDKKPDEPAIPADPEKKPEDSPASPEGEAKPDASTPETPATPDPEKQPEQPRRRGKSSVDKLAEKIDALVDKVSKPETPATQEPVDEARQLRLEAVALLEKEGKASVKEYESYLSKLDTYRSKWEQQHPNDDFDFEAEEHEDWRAKNEPRVSPEALIRAEARVEARRDYARDIQQLREEQLRERVANAAENAAAVAPSQLLSLFEAKSVDELKAKDPHLARAVLESQKPVAELVHTAHEILSPVGRADVNNPRHVAVLGLIQEYENILENLPPDQSAHNGRKFATTEEYQALPAERRANYWTLSREPSMVGGLLVSRYKDVAVARANEFRSWFGAPAAAPAAPATTPPATPKAADPAPAVPATPKEKPPSSSGDVSSPVAKIDINESNVIKYF